MREPRIVLYERDEFARGVYKGYLTAEGLPVRVETRVESLLAAVTSDEPALVVATFDQHAGQGGPGVVELAARLRAARPRSALLAIVRRDDHDAPLRALGAGALEILKKPVSGESLVVAVRRCLTTLAFLGTDDVLRRALETWLAHRRIVQAPHFAGVAEALLDAAVIETRARAGLAFRLIGGASELVTVREAELPGFSDLARELHAVWDGGERGPAIASFGPGEGPLQRLDPKLARKLGPYLVLRAGAIGGERMAVAAFPSAAIDHHVTARLDAHLRHAQAALELAGRFPEGTGEPTIDPLTELPDARTLARAVADAIARTAHVGGAGLAVLAIDLEGFRALNETHGHLTGGRVVVEASRVLSRLVRDVDLVARTGPDEFGILLVSTDGRGADRVTERVREAFARHRFLAREGLDLRIGVTIGAAVYPQHGLTARDLIAAAQRAILRT